MAWHQGFVDDDMITFGTVFGRGKVLGFEIQWMEVGDILQQTRILTNKNSLPGLIT